MSYAAYHNALRSIAQSELNGEDTACHIHALAVAAQLDASTVAAEVAEQVNLLND